MNKLQKLALCLIFSSGAAYAEEFGLNEMQAATKVGIAFYLQEEGKAAKEVKGYAIGKQSDGAKLRIFFTDGSQGKLFCHFHEEHDDHDDHGHDDHDDHDNHGKIEDIDCHII